MSDIRLYVIPRTDMESMTPGRVAAQVSHASTKMMYDLQMNEVGHLPEVQDMLEDWLSEANGFGTTIILKPKTDTNQEKEFKNLANKILSESHESTRNYSCGLVIDPEYFIKDGNTVHIVKDVTTCFFIFGRKEDVDFLIGDYELF